MPEIAEVEYYRKRWDPALGATITRVELHDEKRVLRKASPAQIRKLLTGQKFISSAAHGKQMLFRFGKDLWLGLHLGMTGELRLESKTFAPGKHDHLVLYSSQHALVFEDPRLFGLVLFEQSPKGPAWWHELPPAIVSDQFTIDYLQQKLMRSRSAPLKALLLDQDIFPGVGNWVADEILWQGGLRPDRPASSLGPKDIRKLWEITRAVCSTALQTIGNDYDATPAGWLFDQRWSAKGLCPKHKAPLERITVGGRTTAFCPKCQK